MAGASKDLWGPFWGRVGAHTRLLRPPQRHKGSGKGAVTLLSPAPWAEGTIHMLSWCLSALEKADFPFWSSLPAPLAPLNDSSPATLVESLDLIWTPSIRCQILFILISPLVSSCVHWTRSHRPQVENDHNEQPHSEITQRLFSFEDPEKSKDLPSPAWVARRQRFQKTNQKSYNGEGHNSCCRAPTITQPPCTVPLW